MGNPAPSAPSAPPVAPPTTISKTDLLGRTCFEGSNRRLERHTGFQAESPPGTASNKAQCVTTQMGAVAANDKLPSLLITEAPTTITPGVDPVVLSVSTRNLVRDRFLGAAAGGYYLEASFLNDGGLQRGHFHTACRMLPSTRRRPGLVERSPFFVATQDSKSGTTPVEIVMVPGGEDRGSQGHHAVRLVGR